MREFFLDLLVGESQAAPHYWASVLLAHAMIGVALMFLAGIVAAALFGDAAAGLVLVACVYAAWEIAQFVQGGVSVADGVLDWCAVMLGAVVALAIQQQRRRRSLRALGALAVIGLAGIWKRRGRR